MNDRNVAALLLEAEAVALRLDPPFTWASGRLSPIYCDNRLLMSFPASRRQVTEAFAGRIADLGWHPDVIAGTATAGIPHAAWLADRLDLPMVYVRGAAKEHGKGNRVEGRLLEGEKVVLVEDLISTGGSSLAAAQGIIDAGAQLLGVIAIFSYALDVARERFEAAKVAFDSLTSFPQLLEVSLATGSLDAAQKAILAEWRRDPAAWSLERGGAG